MKIYRQTGDGGETDLPDGSRVSKDVARLEAVGTADELNSLVGMVRAETLAEDMDRLLEQVQNDLLVLGAETAVADPAGLEIRKVGPEHVKLLEDAIGRYDATLPPLGQFILPTGVRAAAALHHARAVCRRAERRLVTLGRNSSREISPQLTAYLNRLADLLFTLARAVNADTGRAEAPWLKK